jgi:hypothetical protein
VFPAQDHVGVVVCEPLVSRRDGTTDGLKYTVDIDQK